jgi:hypothetical protein
LFGKDKAISESVEALAMQFSLQRVKKSERILKIKKEKSPT